MAALIANSETAQDLAAAFLKFKESIPENSTEVLAIVAELFAISTSLQELNHADHDPYNVRRAGEYDEDKRSVLLSLEYTFKDIQRLFGGLNRQQYRTNREAYGGVWRDIQTYFRNESGNTLLTRLEYYKHFINDLTSMVAGEASPDDQFLDLQERIERLVDVQATTLADDLDNLQLGTPRQKSWERRRPGFNQDALQPANRRPQPNPYGRPGYASPTSPPGFGEMPYFATAPEVPYMPGSPTATTATTSTASSSPPTTARDHWLPVAFSQNRPTTVFKVTGSESRCYGENQNGASNKLKVDHDELLNLPFESNFLEVRIYLRARDRRARMWCRSERNTRRSQCVQPITSLRIVRRESCLQICKEDPRRKKLYLWANLRFPSYERLVLFYCSFIALKAQDEGQRVRQLDDHVLEGEMSVFSARIIDDNYTHALQIFKDENSGGVRLQASALKGDLKRCPIWVGFINYKVKALEWIHRAETRKIHLLDLTRFVFSHEYEPQLGPNGEHELHFIETADADHFEQIIADLGDGRI